MGKWAAFGWAGWVFCIGVLTAVPASAAEPAPTTRPVAAQQDLKSLWADLEKGEPAASRAVLALSTRPAETVGFLKLRMPPLKLSTDDLSLLLTALGDDDPAVWTPAFDQLSYLDPRLATDLESLMRDTPDNPARQRLVEILCDYPPGVFKDRKAIKLTPVGKKKDEGYNFVADNSSWWAEDKVARLSADSWRGKKKWTRALRAMAVLEQIGTPEALEIVTRMATGHPDAEPTKFAKELLARRSGDGSPATK